MRSYWKAMAAAAAIVAAPVASAHEFTCEKKVDNQDVIHLYPADYPAKVTYKWTITNPLDVSSTTTNIEDTLFPVLKFTQPLVLAAGLSQSQTDELTIESYEDCARLAGATPNGEITLTNTLTVEWDTAGSVSCDAQVICHPPEGGNGEGCLTRTPGYWGTHPDVTAKFLPLESCGEELTTTSAGATASITEDLCSVGKDHKKYGSPQEAQLVRQCAAAALNVAASEFLGGSCEESLSSERFAECCTSCAGSGSDIARSGCIEDLDAFNNSADTLLVDEEEINLCKVPELEIGSCAAQPQACQTANGNGIVNDREASMVAPVSAVSAAEAGPARPTSGGCSGGPGGALALLGTVGLLALRRRRA